MSGGVLSFFRWTDSADDALRKYASPDKKPEENSSTLHSVKKGLGLGLTTLGGVKTVAEMFPGVDPKNIVYAVPQNFTQNASTAAAVDSAASGVLGSVGSALRFGWNWSSWIFGIGGGLYVALKMYDVWRGFGLGLPGLPFLGSGSGSNTNTNNQHNNQHVVFNINGSNCRRIATDQGEEIEWNPAPPAGPKKRKAEASPVQEKHETAKDYHKQLKALRKDIDNDVSDLDDVRATEVKRVAAIFDTLAGSGYEDAHLDTHIVEARAILATVRHELDLLYYHGKLQKYVLGDRLMLISDPDIRGDLQECKKKFDLMVAKKVDSTKLTYHIIKANLALAAAKEEIKADRRTVRRRIREKNKAE
jgi:hypothetical protein